MKIPKFLIVQNKGAKNACEYLLHTQKPAFLAEILTFNSLQDLEDFQSDTPSRYHIMLNRTATVLASRTNPVRGTIFAAVIVKLFETPTERDFPQPNQVTRGGILSRMGDWLYNYKLNN